MSHIPNRVMPHARAETDNRTGRRERLRDMMSGSRRWASDRLDRTSRTVRRHPGMAASAAVATVLAGIAAVFGPRLWHRRSALSR
jgi:hypothetical protein